MTVRGVDGSLRGGPGQNDHMVGRVQVREIDDDDGRLLLIIRRGTGSMVTWRLAKMVPLSAQGMPVARIAEISFTGAERVRDVIRNFNTDGFNSLHPRWPTARPTAPASTASRPSSQPCATSPSTAPFPRPQRAGRHDPPLQHLAKPPCRRPTPTPSSTRQTLPDAALAGGLWPAHCAVNRPATALNHPSIERDSRGLRTELTHVRHHTAVTSTRLSGGIYTMNDC